MNYAVAGDEAEVDVFTALVVPITVDGSPSIDQQTTARYDWIIGAVIDRLDLNAEAMTKRMVRALESACFDCLAHPSGRQLGQHAAHAADLDVVLCRAAELGVALELNCDPSRLDLDANHLRRAAELGAPVALGTVARSAETVDTRLQLGLITARRGWTTNKTLLNCMDSKAFRSRLAQR